MLLSIATFPRISVVVEVNDNCNVPESHNANCELRSSVVVRDRRTDREVVPEHFVIPHGTGAQLESGGEASSFHASLHPCMSQTNSMRPSPQAIHPFPQGSDNVQGCRVYLEFRGNQVVCVRRGHGREEVEAISPLQIVDPWWPDQRKDA